MGETRCIRSIIATKTHLGDGSPLLDGGSQSSVGGSQIRGTGSQIRLNLTPDLFFAQLLNTAENVREIIHLRSPSVFTLEF